MTLARPLIIDIAGDHLTEQDVNRLKHLNVGGLIYFSRNWQSCKQIQELSASIKNIREDLLIFVDHEGGRVQRFHGDGITDIPEMEKLSDMMENSTGATHERLHKTQIAAEACGYVLGAELRSLGIDLALGPVLDLNYLRCPALLKRTLGSDPMIVSALAASLIQGMSNAGIYHCGKHFPGHGYTETDTHYGHAQDARSYQEIFDRDMLVYRQLGNSLRAIMPSHVIYSDIDQSPAGFSSYWLQNILRDALNFSGVIISDDLGMAAAGFVDGIKTSQAQACARAIMAGCDLVLMCNLSLSKSGLFHEHERPDPRNIPKWDYQNERSQLDDTLDEFDNLSASLGPILNEKSSQRSGTLLAKKPNKSLAELANDSAYQIALEQVRVLQNYNYVSKK
jgi:beta-N-acetylhexosaminidase